KEGNSKTSYNAFTEMKDWIDLGAPSAGDNGTKWQNYCGWKPIDLFLESANINMPYEDLANSRDGIVSLEIYDNRIGSLLPIVGRKYDLEINTSAGENVQFKMGDKSSKDAGPIFNMSDMPKFNKSDRVIIFSWDYESNSIS